MGVSKGYDYVIVGGGSAGCVLANRLSEDGAGRVLLIEAGGRDLNPLIHVPLGMGKMHEYDMFNWGYSTEPEPNMNGRRIEAMRGKVLGGSSSINVMAYTRGHRGDYDRWAQKGARGWSYADVLPYFKRCERWEASEDRWRGGAGPVGTEFARTADPLYDAWIQAALAAGFPETDDYIGKNLQDHLAVIVFFRRLDESTFIKQMRFDRMAVSMIRAYLFGTGPGTVVPGGLHAFVKTRPEFAVPDIEFMFRGAPAAPHLWFPLIRAAYLDGYGIRPTLLHPTAAAKSCCARPIRASRRASSTSSSPR